MTTLWSIIGILLYVLIVLVNSKAVLLDEEECGTLTHSRGVRYLLADNPGRILAARVRKQVASLYGKRLRTYNLRSYRRQESPPDERDLINYYMKIKVKHREYVHIKVSRYIPAPSKPRSPFLRWAVKGFRRQDCICGDTPTCTIPKAATKATG
ncbi:unnamed protein product [Owenia fusiformis]|uniref:Uncharacterized protein n=1 Tax=Owenia fusiformis TaxID=6347 RepID=A0A8J1U4X1_OWEFU|nr:unnamed protein product [Owenia fusiformis]